MAGKYSDTIAHRGMIWRNGSGGRIAVHLPTGEEGIVARHRICMLLMLVHQSTKHTTFPAPHPHFL
jgi:hypothetical protein